MFVNTGPSRLCFLFILMLISAASAAVPASSQGEPPKLERSFFLPKVVGRIDHMAVDVDGQRLFVAARGNNSLEVLDLKTGTHIRSITGLDRPQGVLYIPEFNRIFVTNGGTGTCMVFDGSSYKLIRTIKFSEDADNIRYDLFEKKIYIGYGSGGIGIVDAKTSERVGDIQLPAHPEAFEIEKEGPRIFANLPDAGEIAVIDRQKRRLIARWPLAGSKGNFPVALDEPNHRLFIGCRNPAKILIYSTDSGKVIGTLDIAGDIDDLFHDPLRGKLYASCGEGFTFIFGEAGNGSYKMVSKISTAKGARTSLLVPETGRLYVAIPRDNSRPAEMREFLVFSE